ncbi:hypothetical protein KA005_60105 [bacterium]|nr:hypothetical protein [bacterium]
MKIEFDNYWLGNSMKDGGCFPIHLFDIYADIHPSYRFFGITILNFGISIEFPYKQEVKW